MNREKALLQAVFETAADGILTIDEHGVILSVNPAVLRQFGYTSGEMIGQNVKILMPSPYREEHDKYLATYRQTRVATVIGIGREVVACRKDGTVFPVDLAISETETEDGLVFTGIIRDLSERVKAIELARAKEASDRANIAKSEFLSRMSHELRTPLNSVIGFAQLLEMRNDDEIREAAYAILKAGKHLLNLVNEVLDLSGIEAGRVALSLEPVPLVPIVEQAVDLLQPLASREQIQTKVNLQVDDGCLVLADRKRLLQIVINLFGNSLKFNRPGGHAEITCSASEPNQIQVLFKDTGSGISPEDQPKLFQPFERLGIESIEGTGLGLVLSRRFAELMQGTVELVESSSEGSAFSLTLCRAEASHAASASESRRLRHHRRVLSSGKILYIEDNVSNMKLVEMTLAEWPHVELIPATHGLEGFELAKSVKPDVILLDLHLPDVNGAEVLRLLKDNRDTALIPVVVISADATQGQIGNLRKAGAYDYLTKPIDINSFMDILGQLLPVRRISD